jgi:hypothetical protein
MSDKKPFEFNFGDDGPNLGSAVFQALGAASTCWESMSGTGVFNDVAREIGETLLEFIRNEIDCKSVVHDCCVKAEEHKSCA